MFLPKPLVALILALFAALTFYVVLQVGYLNLFIQNLNHPAGWQVFADLSIALSLLLIMLWKDAKALGRNWWVWAIFTLFVGSIGPLLYMLTRRPS